MASLPVILFGLAVSIPVSLSRQTTDSLPFRFNSCEVVIHSDPVRSHRMLRGGRFPGVSALDAEAFHTQTFGTTNTTSTFRPLLSFAQGDSLQ